MSTEKKTLTKQHTRAEIYIKQLGLMASELQYGRLIVEFDVQHGELKQAHLTGQHKKLCPFDQIS